MESCSESGRGTQSASVWKLVKWALSDAFSIILECAMGTNISIPGFGWSQKRGQAVQIEPLMKAGSSIDIEEVFKSSSSLAGLRSVMEIQEMSNVLNMGIAKTFSKVELDELRNTGRSNGRELVWCLMKLGKHTRFSLHAHPNIEVIYVIRGVIYEYRLVVEDEITRKLTKLGDEVSSSKGHCQGPDLSSLSNPRFLSRSTRQGNFLLNETGSIHLTYTLDEGAELLVLWGNGHANIPAERLPKIPEEMTRPSA